MRIAFFTEGGYVGNVDRSRDDLRTDLAWQVALESYHHPLGQPITSEYDLGIIIVPKKNPRIAIENLYTMREKCKQLAMMQEGPHVFWQDWDLNTQILYWEFVTNMDIIYCHNSIDVKYYRGMFGHMDVRILRTLMIENDVVYCDASNRDGVMIGGNFCSWYSGFDSYSIGSEFDSQIYTPSMGRKRADERYISDIEFLPYIKWREWMVELSKRKYAVHLMRTHAAGTFALNCASLGIPCIGYKGLDTQEHCHPKLSVDVGDMVTARKLAKHLYTNKQFYDHCSVVAKSNYKQFYSEKIFLENFNSKFK